MQPGLARRGWLTRRASTALVLTAFACIGFAGAAGAGANEIVVGVTEGPPPGAEMLVLDTDAPGTSIERLPVGGLLAGETLTGLDMRTATGELVLLTSVNRALILDPETGATVQAGPQISTTLLSTIALRGFDFNPAVDRARIVNSGDVNWRYNPLTFSLVDSDGDPNNGTTPDGTLAYAIVDPNVGDDPVIVGVAHDRNDNDPGTGTTVYGIDVGQAAGADVLVTVNPPNNGVLNTIGQIGLNAVDAAFDIPRTGNVGFAATEVLGAGTSTLRTVNLSTGATASLGATPGVLGGMTIALAGGVAPLGTSTLVAEGGLATVQVTREGDSLAPATVAYRTTDGTATGGEDYASASGFLTFAQGDASEQVAVPVSQDSAAEGTESFALELGPASGGAVITDGGHTVKIVDDDAKALSLLVSPIPPASARALRKSRKLPVEFACSQACTAELALRKGKKVLATGIGSLAGAGAGKAVLRLSKAGRKALGGRKRRGSLKLSVIGTAKDAAGNTATDSARLRLPR